MEPMPLWQGILAIFIMFPWLFLILFIFILVVIFGPAADKAKAQREKVQKETDFLRAWAVRKAIEEDLKPNPITLDQFLTKQKGKGR